MPNPVKLLRNSLRKEVLKRVFERGVNSASKKELDDLFKHMGGKLYRHEYDPEELAELGFSKTRRTPVGDWSDYGDMPGLYWAEGPYMHHKAINEEDYMPNVWGLKRPGSKTGDRPIFEADKEEYDAITKGLDFARRGRGWEIVQRKPGNTLAKIKTDKGIIYRILGLLGAISATSPEAEEGKSDAR